ncbi:MAG TPA: hypothetical protein VFZ97_06475 [Acidimicrobiales bacterium]
MLRAKSRPVAEDATLTDSKGLTREEDDELRRLNYFLEVGSLSDSMLERMVELRLRDRRKSVRPPREFGEDDSPPDAGHRLRWID